ncbi:MAG: hypothetical protein ABFC88_12585 [Thermoguttaceae bacterium]
MILPDAFLILQRDIDYQGKPIRETEVIHPSGFYCSWLAPIYDDPQETARQASYYEEGFWNCGVFLRFPELLDPTIPTAVWVQFRDLTENAFQRYQKRGDHSEEATNDMIAQFRDILDALLTLPEGTKV